MSFSLFFYIQFLSDFNFCTLSSHAVAKKELSFPNFNIFSFHTPSFTFTYEEQEGSKCPPPFSLTWLRIVTAKHIEYTADSLKVSLTGYSHKKGQNRDKGAGIGGEK